MKYDMGTSGGVVGAFAQLEALVDAAIIDGINRAARMAQKTAITKYMQGGGKDPIKNPPNPPPGPLKIRTGDLRRAVDIVLAYRVSGDTFMSGLKVDLSAVAYGRIHELGGFAGRGRSVRIPARPYLRPALKDSIPIYETMIAERLFQAARKW
jgi:hypothetical protein